jgi:hypothetical protein
MFDTVGPSFCIEEAFISQNLNGLGIVVFILEQPHDLVDVKNVTVVQILLAHKFKNVFSTSVVKDVL